MREGTSGATTLDAMREDYDWIEAFGYAGHPNTCATGYQGGPDLRRANPVEQDVALDPFTLDDVESIEACDEGENDGAEWVALGKLKDGRWFFLSAGCDYTGWDCQAGGSATLAPTRDVLLKFGVTKRERQRLGLTQERT